jgi:hypothetical protein
LIKPWQSIELRLKNLIKFKELYLKILFVLIIHKLLNNLKTKPKNGWMFLEKYLLLSDKKNFKVFLMKLKFTVINSQMILENQRKSNLCLIY